MLVSKKSYSDLCTFMREFCKIFSCTDPTTLCVENNQKVSFYKITSDISYTFLTSIETNLATKNSFSKYYHGPTILGVKIQMRPFSLHFNPICTEEEDNKICLDFTSFFPSLDWRKCSYSKLWFNSKSLDLCSVADEE